MTLTQLQVFLSVVGQESFTRAGETLCLTQSAVSHAVAELERELGTALLHRDRRGVALTEVGRSVVAHAQAILAHVEAIEQEVAAVRGVERGTLRIASIASAVRRLLPELLGEFRRRYPGIDLVLTEGADQEVAEWVRSRVVDVGVVTLPVEGLETVPIAADELLAVLPSGHSLAQRRVLGIPEIAEDTFVMSTGGCEPLIRNAFQAAGVTPRVRSAIRDLGTLLALVEQGLGVTLVPELALPPAVSGVRVARLDPPVWRELAVAVRTRAGASPAALAFLEEVERAAAVECQP